mgnify:CR=1 FL=1
MPPRARARWKHVFLGSCGDGILRRSGVQRVRGVCGRDRCGRFRLLRGSRSSCFHGGVPCGAAGRAGAAGAATGRGGTGVRDAAGAGRGGIAEVCEGFAEGAGSRKTWAAPVPRQARTEMKPGRQVQAARRPQARKRRATRTPGLGLPGPEARQVRTARERRVSRKPGRPWCGRGFPTIRGAAAGRGSGAAVPARRKAQGW